MSKHAYNLKTTSRKHANKHIIRPQLTDSIVQKFFWVLGKTPRSRSTISYSWSSSLDHMRRFSSHRQSFLNHGQDLLNLGKFVSVFDELSVGLPYSLSLSFKNEIGRRELHLYSAQDWPCSTARHMSGQLPHPQATCVSGDGVATGGNGCHSTTPSASAPRLS